MAHALHCIGEDAALEWRTTHLRLRGGCSVSRRRAMLYTIAVVLLVLWLLGFVSGYTIGAFIHVLLVVAVVLFLVGLLSGRRIA
jgi:hypothetical protein